MNTYKLTILISLLWLTACSTTNTVSEANMEDEFSELRTQAEGRDVEIISTDRTKHLGQFQSINNQELTWIDDKTQELKTARLDQLDRLEIILKGKGAKRGLLIGFSSGIMIVTGLYLSSRDSNTQDEPYSELAEVVAIAFASLLTGVGTLSGLVIGAGRGYRVIYIFNDSKS